jgi:hypothetical protein
MSQNGRFMHCVFCIILAVIGSVVNESFAQSGMSGSAQIPSEPSLSSGPNLNGSGVTSSDIGAAGKRNPETATISPYSPTTSNGSVLGGNSFLTTPTEPERTTYFEEAWTWQILPEGLLYKSYLASGREPRFGSQWVHVNESGWLWDVALGARAGVLRYGNTDPVWPEGWQVDIEGAAFPRLNLDHERDLDSVDFRFGVPLTVRRGPWEGKFGYYHISSHMGDEYLVRNDTLNRLNYVRENMVLGVGYYLNPNIRLYAEAEYAFYTDGGAKPWGFQFGAEYSPIDPALNSGAPFFAVNGLLRQEVDFSGNVTLQTGWQWRGKTGRLFRVGLQYMNGLSNQEQFYNHFEEQLGVGMWYDF